MTTPALRVPGYETRRYTFNATVGSYVVSMFQRREIPGARKVRYGWDAEGIWTVQIAGTAAAFAKVSELALACAAEHGYRNARSFEIVDGFTATAPGASNVVFVVAR